QLVYFTAHATLSRLDARCDRLLLVLARAGPRRRGVSAGRGMSPTDRRSAGPRDDALSTALCLYASANQHAARRTWPKSRTFPSAVENTGAGRAWHPFGQGRRVPRSEPVAPATRSSGFERVPARQVRRRLPLCLPFARRRH